jgi:hypothetical protein
VATVTKTAPTFTQIYAPVILANSSLGTLQTLDLKDKIGATILIWIGRRASTTPTRAGYVTIRHSNNNAVVFPSQVFDLVGQGPTTAAAATTLSANAAIGASTISITSATGFAVGDTICLSESSGARLQFARVAGLSGTTLTLERNLRLASNSGDTVTNLADARRQYIPGGDIYEIRTHNFSGLDLVFAVEAIIDNGETIT